MLLAFSKRWKEKASTALTCVSFFIQHSLSNVSRDVSRENKSNMFVDPTFQSHPRQHGKREGYEGPCFFCVYKYIHICIHIYISLFTLSRFFSHPVRVAQLRAALFSLHIRGSFLIVLFLVLKLKEHRETNASDRWQSGDDASITDVFFSRELTEDAPFAGARCRFWRFYHGNKNRSVFCSCCLRSLKMFAFKTRWIYIWALKREREKEKCRCRKCKQRERI